MKSVAPVWTDELREFHHLDQMLLDQCESPSSAQGTMTVTYQTEDDGTLLMMEVAYLYIPIDYPFLIPGPSPGRVVQWEILSAASNDLHRPADEVIMEIEDFCADKRTRYRFRNHIQEAVEGAFYTAWESAHPREPLL